ncbi:hypothetical protein, partial [Streptococcus pyogenes]|uniref:hypothetical protein n=1 Tax=Streptococcus pyogenes TaxID=1314 RepID=UPI001B348AB8
TRRKLAENSQPLNPWGSKAKACFFLKLALGTIWGVVVAPHILDFSTEKSPSKIAPPNPIFDTLSHT